jgi:hypothetical protein
VYQRIINLIPPHEVYIEPFFGSGAIMARKRPASRNIGIDLSGKVGPGREVRERLAGCDFEFVTGCGIAFLAGFSRDAAARETFVYADPPYLPETLTRLHYDCNLTTEDHVRLLGVLRAFPGKVALSGYRSGLYESELPGWRMLEYRAMTRGGPRMEALWLNYDPPVVPWDLGFAGADFTDRQRIKRKAARWRAKLEAMSEVDRAAVIEAIRGYLEHSQSRPCRISTGMTTAMDGGDYGVVPADGSEMSIPPAAELDASMGAPAGIDVFC